MRIQHKIPPNNNEYRVITKFLFFPKTIGYETRWLETATWTERYVYGGSYEYPYCSWESVDWGKIEEPRNFY